MDAVIEDIDFNNMKKRYHDWAAAGWPGGDASLVDLLEAFNRIPWAVSLFGCQSHPAEYDPVDHEWVSNYFYLCNYVHKGYEDTATRFFKGLAHHLRNYVVGTTNPMTTEYTPDVLVAYEADTLYTCLIASTSAPGTAYPDFINDHTIRIRKCLNEVELQTVVEIFNQHIQNELNQGL